ncbi:MAG: LysR substrate-binding domain-containing protein [Chloroflexota bacterium]
MPLAILPDYEVRQEVAAGSLRAIPIAGKPLRRTLKLVWATDNHLSPVARVSGGAAQRLSGYQ